jgi:hypothetical protein
MRLAALLIIAGFVLMALAWNGAAGNGAVAAQIPYLVSGSVPGLGLVVLGTAIAVVIEFRRAQAEMATRIEDALGSTHASDGLGLTAVPTDGSAVVASRTTYHSPGCRLIEGRSDLQVMSPADAAARGLAPCRICEPAEVAPDVAIGVSPAVEEPQPTVRKVEAPRATKRTAKKTARAQKKSARKRVKKAAKQASKRAKKSA